MIKKIKNWLFIVLTLFCHDSYCQEYQSVKEKVGNYIEMDLNNPFGVISVEGKELRITARRGKVLLCESNEGLSLIDTLGNFILRPLLGAKFISEGNAIIVRQENLLSGLYSYEGEKLLPLKFHPIKFKQSIGCFEVAILHNPDARSYDQNRSYGLFSVEQGFILNPEFCDLILYSEKFIGISKDCRKYTLLDLSQIRNDKNIVSVLDYKYDRLDVIINGAIKAKKDDKWGLLEMDGHVRIPFEYNKISAFTDSTYIVNQGYLKNGLVDLKGNIIFPVEFDRLGPFYTSSDLIIVKHDNGKYGLFDRNLNFVISPEYEFLKGVTEHNYGGVNNLHFIAKKSGKYGCLDSKGKELVPLIYSNLTNDLHSNYLIVENERRYGLIDRNNNIIIPVDKELIVSLWGKGYQVKKENKWSIINEDGASYFDLEFDELLEGFDANSMIAKRDNHYGIITIDGEFLVPIICENIEKDNGCFNVRVKKYSLKLDKKGNCIQDCPTPDVLKSLGLPNAVK